eukprot:gnl/MRDRNA2_/MRDRNA2_63382_c0_seq1.p1 gnl/MRDRNA2_/MRDRNA2_63382_c0~~gnl/MRDRNA2_/MRDRNA2_63382_c0_seq1.p1  ORF type:complete len:278 (+),score=75.72 gnl/MRDRNA2_/MRDRNA2_63382_c0_seq1:101-934(+)
MEPQSQLATSLLAAVGFPAPQGIAMGIQVSPVEMQLASALLKRAEAAEDPLNGGPKSVADSQADLLCGDLIAKATAYLEGEQLDPAQAAAIEAARKAGINLNLKPPEASQEQMRAAAQQAAKLASMSKGEQSKDSDDKDHRRQREEPQQPKEQQKSKEPEQKRQDVVESIKRHSSQPIAMLAFEQEDYAQMVLARPPIMIGDVKINQYKPVDKDPKALYIMWAGTREAISDEAICSFFSDYVKDYKRSKKSSKRASDEALLDGGKRTKPQPKTQLRK